MSWMCLMYHDVLPETRASGGGGERFATTLEAFETMLGAIDQSGHVGCSVDQAVKEGGSSIAISFDDGTRSQFDYAVPSLLDRGMSATFFVTTDWVGRPGYMTWDELRQISALGMSVQSHTRSHPFLSELNETAVMSEFFDSKTALDRELKQETDQISLPGGNQPRRGLSHLLEEAGYRVVAGSRWGRNPHPTPHVSRRLLRRCTMRATVSSSDAQELIRPNAWRDAARFGRESALNTVRATLGASRYASWRKSFLDALTGETS
jgi:peptidoglycan/xylan/chitin deacetylase (PgdA/CDA1 family)